MIWPCTVTSRTRETDPYRQNCKHIIFSFNLIDLISLSLRRDSVHKCDYVVGPAGRARRCEALFVSNGRRGGEQAQAAGKILREIVSVICVKLCRISA